jgi:hypothetical protein
VGSRLFNDAAFTENTSFIKNVTGKCLMEKEQDRRRDRMIERGERVRD